MEFWGDGAGGAQVLTVNNVNGSELEITTETYLYCQTTLAGTATTAVDVQVQLSLDARQNWRTYDLCPLVAFRGDRTQINFVLRVFPSCWVRIGLARRGGDGTSTAFIEAYLREHSGDIDETKPYVVNRASALDATLLTGAYQFGDWFNLGDADELEVLLTKTLAGNPTQVDLQIQTSPDLGTTGYLPSQIDAIAVGVETRVATTKRLTDIGAAVGTWSHLFTGLPKNSWVRIGGLFTGGTAPTIALMALCHRI